MSIMKNIDTYEYFCDADSIAIGNKEFFAQFPVPDGTHEECEGNIAVVLDDEHAELFRRCPVLGRFGGNDLKVFADDCTDTDSPFQSYVCSLPNGCYTVRDAGDCVAICRE